MKIEDVDGRCLIEGTEARFVHADRMTLAYWTFEPGVDLPDHSHPHEQITNVVEGEFEFTIDGVTETMGPGHYRVIPPDITHSGRAVTLCKIIDVFCPVREDYR